MRTQSLKALHLRLLAAALVTAAALAAFPAVALAEDEPLASAPAEVAEVTEGEGAALAPADEPAPMADPALVADPEPDPVPVVEPEPDPVPTVEPEPTAEPQPEPEPIAESEPSVAAEPEPTSDLVPTDDPAGEPAGEPTPDPDAGPAPDPDSAPVLAAPEDVTPTDPAPTTTDSPTAAPSTPTRTSLSGAVIERIRAQRYTGKKVRPKPTITVGGVTLRRGTDYTLTYRRNRKVGRATIIIKGRGAYRGTRRITFRIARAVKVAKLTIRRLKARTYTGERITPTLRLTHKGHRLVEGLDYTVSYRRNKKVGTARVIIRGKGIYRGRRTVTFKIRRRSLKKADITIVSKVPANGKVHRPRPTVVVAGRTLKRGVDYTLSYRNNREVGTATVTIRGKGNYKSKALARFKVVRRKSLDKAKISTETSGDKSVLVVKYKKRRLVEGVDYVVDRKVRKKTGMVKATITGIGFFKDDRKAEYCEDAQKERLGKTLLKLCKSQMGVPYKRGATKWNELMDCSGLTFLAYQHAGIDIPRFQSYWGGGENSQVYLVHTKNWKTRVEDLVPGDIVFYGKSWKQTDHVGIYAGNGMNYEAGPDEVIFRTVIDPNWDPKWHRFIGGGSPVEFS